MRIAHTQNTQYGPGDPVTWGGNFPDCDLDEAVSIEEQIAAEAAHIYQGNVHTPFSAAEISEALGEMTEAEHLEMAEAQADPDDAVAGRFLKRIVREYWENWAEQQAKEKFNGSRKYY